ncbi:MAG: site-specific integrase [Blastochloris viridis]|uniref:Site-specific integrase n=1 Tax=Blastochloris viridis TaxID=1079 RepID=A0A6N4RDJ6_BLAVI|nr:MAG: site-specific integrase [Blastochloris viridis]
MAVIEKRERKDGIKYRAKVRIHGFPTQEKTFDKISEAKIWAQQVESSIRKGEFLNVVKEAKKHNLSEVIARYRLEVLPNKALNTQRMENTYLKYWERELGEYALSYIDPQTISLKLTELKSSGDSRIKAIPDNPIPPQRLKSAKTIKHYRDHLEILFNNAKQWGWAGTSPLTQIQGPKRINNARTRYLDDSERESLLKACQSSPNKQLYPIVIFALSTGARLNEILKLTLNDVSLKNGQAILRETKNGETRTIPITSHLKDILEPHILWVKEQYSLQAHALKNQYLFPRTDGLAPIDIRKAWENARTKAEIQDFRFHDLRHSAASYLAMNGATLLEIAAVLGHKTLQMVKRYSHLSESHTANIVSKMNNTIFRTNS